MTPDSLKEMNPDLVRSPLVLVLEAEDEESEHRHAVKHPHGEDEEAYQLTDLSHQNHDNCNHQLQVDKGQEKLDA